MPKFTIDVSPQYANAVFPAIAATVPAVPGETEDQRAVRAMLNWAENTASQKGREVFHEEGRQKAKAEKDRMEKLFDDNKPTIT